MEKRIAFRGMDSSPATENFLNEKLAKVEMFLESEKSPVYLDVVLTGGSTSGQERNIFNVEIRVKGPHFSIIAQEEGYEIFATIERAVDTAVQEINKMKKKRLKMERKADSFKGA